MMSLNPLGLVMRTSQLGEVDLFSPTGLEVVEWLVGHPREEAEWSAVHSKEVTWVADLIPLTNLIMIIPLGNLILWEGEDLCMRLRTQSPEIQEVASVIDRETTEEEAVEILVALLIKVEVSALAMVDRITNRVQVSKEVMRSGRV